MIEITPEYLASQGLSITFPQRFWAKVNKNGPVPAHCPELGPCWVWTAHTVKGYGEIGCGRFGDGSIYAHRASWLLHYGSIPDNLQVCHSCDNPACVRPNHLWTGNQDENIADMFSKGRNPIKDHHGESNPKRKLSWSEVEKIRQMHSNGSNERALAKLFGVVHGTIWFIVRNRTWVRPSPPAMESPHSGTPGP